jgi:transcriptional regulator with XRE-family HTH domain
MNKIGYYIRSVRVGKNLTAEYVAANLKVAQSTYSAYESGKAKLVHPNFFKIAAQLEIDPLDLFKKGYIENSPDYGFGSGAALLDQNRFSAQLYELRNELEKKTKYIGVLEYRLAKYESVKENKMG